MYWNFYNNLVKYCWFFQIREQNNGKKIRENGGDDFDDSQIPDDFNSDPANVVDQSEPIEQMYSKDGNDLIFLVI